MIYLVQCLLVLVESMIRCHYLRFDLLDSFCIHSAITEVSGGYRRESKEIIYNRRGVYFSSRKERKRI